MGEFSRTEERDTEREEEQGVASASLISIQSKEEMSLGEKRENSWKKREEGRVCNTWYLQWEFLQSLPQERMCMCVCVCSDSALRLLDQKNWKKGHCIHPYLCLSCSLHPFLLTLAPHNSPNPAAHSEQTVPLSTVRVCVVFLYIFTLPHTSEVIWSCCICPSICIIYIVY